MRSSTRLLAWMCLWLLPISAAHAQSVPAIERINITPRTAGLAIEITLSAPFVPEGTILSNPDRLVFDFPGFRLQSENRHIAVNNGPVRNMRTAQFQQDPPIARIVLDLKEPAHFTVNSVGNRVVIEIPTPSTTSASVDKAHGSSPLEKKEELSSPTTPSPTPITAPSSVSRPTAYSLQARAKTLQLQQLQALEDKAQGGDPEAETTLALAYHGATLLRRDDEQALLLLHKAADQGFMPAQESLGIFSEMGIGMEKPAPTEAIDWYTKAAKQGSLDAATNIALMYADGIGIPKDPAQALTWFRQAADGGDATAQYNLALIYRNGKGVPKDHKESARWLTAAADQNLVPAVMDLAAQSLHPSDGTPADPARAIHYYERAANLGSAPAATTLGDIFTNGTLDKPDYAQAMKWYEKAADQGMPQAQFRLGQLLARNNQSRANRIAAYQWLTLAADSMKEGAAPLADLKKSMTPDEIHKADQQAEAWRDGHPRNHPTR